MRPPPITAVAPAEWAINDEVIRLREWATGTVHLLTGARSRLMIGTAPTCAIRVMDPLGRVAPEHAVIERQHGGWIIVARDDGRGLLVDGAARERAELRPGIELSLGGGVTLIAESLRLIALREELARMLGWSPARQEAVDLALRRVRDHDLHRRVLILSGDHDDRELVPIAAELHRLTLGDGLPFVVYDPNRRAVEAEQAPIRTFAELPAALEAAGDGTLCLLHSKTRRKELIPLYFQVLPQSCKTHLVRCAGRAEIEKPLIVIPTLDQRRTEHDRLINEYVQAAAERLYCARRVKLSAADRSWLRTNACGSLAELQEATLRLVAVRDAGSLNAAAPLLGISHVALGKWLAKRGFSRALRRPRRPAR